ncbi:MAG TPA: hypothetical protein VL614_15095 [Acetobacteraceae bacterium]|jgi:hypothetical protein|nr:hypothetical protein [Acetobacteraceae bacterium]
MARKAAPKLTVVPTPVVETVDLTTLVDTSIDVAAMVDALAPAAPADAAPPAPPAPRVPSLAELRAEADQDVLQQLPESYTLAIAGQYDSLLAAGMFAGTFAKALGMQVCIIDASGAPVRCFDPPAKRGRGGDKSAAVSNGPRGADWGSKSGQAIKLMMREEGATMDEMKEITGWTFGKKYVAQLMRSFGVAITTHEATARTKRTWHATIADTVAHVDDAEAEEAAEREEAAQAA